MSSGHHSISLGIVMNVFILGAKTRWSIQWC